MEIPPDVIAEFWFSVRKASSLMDRAGDRLFRGGLGIGLTQYMVLSVVDARPGQFNQQSVAQTLGITKAAVSRQIEIGLAAGYITTSVSTYSRRDTIVTLTPKGTRLVRKGDALLATGQQRAFQPTNEADLHAALRALHALIESIAS
jgi:DNA-binding MarR family transcriptional regulator